jgi:rhodanese-related sulfurtransferase
MLEVVTKTKKAIVRQRYAAGVKPIMTIQLIKLLLLSSLSAFIYSHVHAADLTNDPLPTVQENVATHKAVLVDVREPGEWKEGHVEGAISLPLSSLKKGVDTSALEHQLPKDKIVYTHCVMGVRAVAASKILDKLGYNVRPLKAGYEDLVKAGFEKAAN